MGAKANDKNGRYKVIETTWEPTEGLRAFEEVEWENYIQNDKPDRREIYRLWGFINDYGEVAIPLRFDCVWKFRDGLAKVREKGKWGAIDRTGTEVIPIKYQTLHFTSDELVQVQVGGKWGVLARDGSVVVEPCWEYVFPFHGEFAGVKLDGKYGFVNRMDAVVVAPQFDEIGLPDADGRVKVRTGMEWRIINLTEQS
jgi:hypothetical protein